RARRMRARSVPSERDPVAPGSPATGKARQQQTAARETREKPRPPVPGSAPPDETSAAHNYLLIGLADFAVTCDASLSYSALETMPFECNSSFDLNGRASTILSAVAASIPGNVMSCSRLAEL